MNTFMRCVFFVILWISSCSSDVTPDDTLAIKSGQLAKFISKSWKHCMNLSTLGLCLKQRSLLALDNLIKTNEVIEFPGEFISLVKKHNYLSTTVRKLSEDDLDKYLPKDVRLQEKTLDMLLESAYTKFLTSRSLQVQFPSRNVKGAIDESRGDKKKGNGFAMGAMMAGMMMVPMALAGIGMLAGKSLMVSMLALMLSALLASRKSSEGHGSSYEVISLPAGGHHHGRRMSISHDVAYNAHESHES